jgi:hypothetical protein
MSILIQNAEQKARVEEMTVKKRPKWSDPTYRIPELRGNTQFMAS